MATKATYESIKSASQLVASPNWETVIGEQIMLNEHSKDIAVSDEVKKAINVIISSVMIAGKKTKAAPFATLINVFISGFETGRAFEQQEWLQMMETPDA